MTTKSIRGWFILILITPLISKCLKKKKMLHVLGVVLIQQFSLKAGFNFFGKDGEDSVTKELNQHDDMQNIFGYQDSQHRATC